jgi:hypothetical protein
VTIQQQVDQIRQCHTTLLTTLDPEILIRRSDVLKLRGNTFNGCEEANYARTRQAPEYMFRRQRPTKERKPAAFDVTTNWRDYIVHFNMIAELNC